MFYGYIVFIANIAKHILLCWLASMILGNISARAYFIDVSTLSISLVDKYWKTGIVVLFMSNIVIIRECNSIQNDKSM